MRMSPIAVWCSQLSDEELKRAVKIDTNHTHHLRIVVDCNITFALACKNLLNGGSPDEAYSAAKEFALASLVKEWWEEMEGDQMQAVNRKIGWVKIAFQRAFYYLNKGTGFEEALKELLTLGGDTDTNAAIVGMLLGARDGLAALNEESVAKVMKWENSRGGHRRPDFLIPGKVFMQKFDDFFNCIPEKLNIVFGLE